MLSCVTARALNYKGNRSERPEIADYDSSRYITRNGPEGIRVRIHVGIRLVIVTLMRCVMVSAGGGSAVVCGPVWDSQLDDILLELVLPSSISCCV